MKRAPAYQFYGSDFEQDTADMSNEEVGAYVRMLNFQWKHGFVHDNFVKLSKVIRDTPARAKKVWSVLEEKFPTGDDGKRRNRRMEEVRNKQGEFKDRMKSLSDAGVSARTVNRAVDRTVDNDGDRTVNSTVSLSGLTSPTPTPTPEPEQRRQDPKTDPAAAEPAESPSGPRLDRNGRVLTPQQLAVAGIEDWFKAREIKPPESRVIAAWLGKSNADVLFSALEQLEGGGKLFSLSGDALTSYVFACVNGLASDVAKGRVR